MSLINVRAYRCDNGTCTNTAVDRGLGVPDGWGRAMTEQTSNRGIPYKKITHMCPTCLEAAILADDRAV